MFYEVLMEKKAQQVQQNEQSPGLSLGQKAGVVGAGALGSVGSVAALGLGSQKVTPLRTFFDHGTKKERAAYDTARAGFNSVKENMDSIEQIARRGTDQQVKDLLKSGKDIPQGTSEAINKLRAAKTQVDALGGISMREIPLNTRIQMREHLLDAEKELDDILSKRKSMAFDAYNKTISPLADKRLLRNKVIFGGTMLGGGLAAGYGAKKLFDRFNARKQERN